MRRTSRGKKLSWMLIVCLLVGLYAGNLSVYAAGSDSEIPNIVANVSPSVVAIIGKPTDGKDSDHDRFNLAHGTGVIVKSNGVIVTNAHVVKSMKNIVVVTSDGKTYPGKTTHYDEESDLALIKIDAIGLSAATFAAPNDIKVGETVMAIGTPISFALRNSVTVGIISGMDRSVESPYQLLQTDAAINPGNSGGALVNMQGKVVGINSQKYVDYSVESLGFAIPVNTVQYVLEHFEKYGKVMRPYMGLELEESWEAVVGLPAKEALKVAYVDPDSPAAQAGIKQGDTIVSFDQASVKTIVEYNELMKKYLPKETLRVTLHSGGQTVVRSVVLGEDPSASKSWVQDSEGGYIDDDQGKTKIGDSHFGWSMKYPAGLIQAFQSDDGSRVTFGDSKGEFGISISVEEKISEELSVTGLLRKLAMSSDDTVLEKRYLDQEPVPYAKVVAKSDEDQYYQARAYQKGDKVYYIALIVTSEDNYKNKVKLNAYLDLLDSFSFSFDAKDGELKDISIFQEGGTTFTNEYGLSFELPSGWEENKYGGEMTYSNEDADQDVSVQVTSASSGDTLADWVARDELQFTGQYAEEYRQTGELKDENADGVPVKQVRHSWRMGGDTWNSQVNLYFIKDKYKYKISVDFKKDDHEQEAAELIDTIVKSMKVSKDTMNTSLGYIQDENELLDPNGTNAYKNEKYHYSVRIPELWSTPGSYYKDSPRANFNFTGGSLTVEADDKSSVEDVMKKLEQGHKKSNENDPEYTYTITDDSTFGEGGKKIAIRYNLKKAPYEQTEYVFRSHNISYTITLKMNDAVHTEANAARAEAAVQSFQYAE